MRQSLIASLSEYGLIIQGEVGPEDDVLWPEIDGVPAKSVVLIGHGGSSFWPHFSHWLAQQDNALSDPLDTWSKEVLTDIARAHGANAYFPSDKPYRPFQRWAMRGLGVKPSPLGILMHPKFGLWHGFRGALAFEKWDIEKAPMQAHPCESCDDKPCLSACPVDAFSSEGLDRVACHDYLATSEVKSCMLQGCGARNACPVRAEYRYATEQLQFHMSAYQYSF